MTTDRMCRPLPSQRLTKFRVESPWSGQTVRDLWKCPVQPGEILGLTGLIRVLVMTKGCLNFVCQVRRPCPSGPSLPIGRTPAHDLTRN